MRKVYSLLLIAAIWTSCKTDTKKAEAGSTIGPSSELAEDDNLPYKAVKRMDWEKGDPKNIEIAMNLLKCYEMKDSVRMKEYLADSVKFQSAAVGNYTSSRREMIKYLYGVRDKWSDHKIEMNNYETVRNKNTGENWVSLWYTEKLTDKSGKQDSALSMDEYKIVNGKVAIMDTKSRRLGQQ